MVGKRKRPDDHLGWINVDLIVSTKIFGKVIVVSQHDIHFYRRVLFAPRTKLIPFEVYIAVEEIAHKQNVSRICGFDYFIQTPEVVVRAMAGNGDAGFAEVRNLANVKITHQNKLRFFPVDSLLRQQYKRIIFYP